ncbi:MHS family MFS transporter [Amycolatopsis rubida]|uniref:MHS family MFS transporter n=1 Tax=Amycolatopsis rubida TaxID=112413 RepID=A0ABX0C2T9_9PSEU|nr:MFS transporter [Amycolatopsis rubida]NEC61115.1 MHS family MFS transporter [Amycolatopsis rubida]
MAENGNPQRTTNHAPPDPAAFRRIAFASLIGSVIEAYDFALYGFAAALVFPKVFFPSLGPAAGTIASLATLGVAFVARPIGAILFGYFGDRYGRKATLIATVLGMGVGTTLMGLIPSAETIGSVAPILIVVLRAVQGLALGGEWAGAILFVTEHAPPNRRGFYAMFPQLGQTLPTILSAGTFLLVNLVVGEDTFVSWGWRVPFIASIVLVALGLYIRLRVEETPVFVRDQQRTTSSRPPLLEAFKRQPSTIARCAGVALTAISFVYVAQSFLSNFGVTHVGLSKNNVLVATALSGVFYTIFCALASVLSDRYGGRRIIVGAEILGAAWALALFPLLSMNTAASFTVALCVTMGIAGLALGAVGPFLPEQFPTRYRYTASGISYQITGVIGGGIAPLVAPIIVDSWGTTAFGIVLAAMSVVAAICTYSLKDRSRQTLDWSPES